MASRILIVDSNMTTRRQVIFVLLPAGFDVSVAEDAVEAQKVMAREKMDLVLLGASMSDSYGLSLVGRLFSSPATSTIPTLVIADSPEAHLAADQAGAREVISGPIDGPALLAAVERHVHSSVVPTTAPASLLNDADRLEAVAALRPGPSGDPDLDRFTHLAAKMLQVPASTITLLEKDEQIYASQTGVGEPWSSAGGSPLEYSYCQFAVTSRQPLRIDDARKHPLVSSSPAVTELEAIAYVGIPLITNDDLAVGTLCVIDSQPRVWTDHEVGVLEDLAGILTAQLNTTRGQDGRHSAH
jgi:CheY-like chemotaxis protein